VLATAKAGNSLRVYDGETGVFLRALGAAGGAEGLARPNGVFVSGDLAFVVERDSRRVQVFDLQRNQSVGTFGGDSLRRPYGIWVWPQPDRSYRVFVTDNYETGRGNVPPDAELGERIKHFDVSLADGVVSARLVSSF